MLELQSTVPPTSPGERMKDGDIERMSHRRKERKIERPLYNLRLLQSAQFLHWPKQTMMFLQPIVLLLVVLAAVSCVQGEGSAFDFKGVRPRNPDSYLPLKLKCSFDLNRSSLTSVTRLKIMRRNLREDKTRFRSVAVVGPKGVGYGLPPSLIVASGRIGRIFSKSRLEVTYKVKAAGYCYEYACVAEGKDEAGTKKVEHKKIKINSVRKTSCH
ncbi:hypothetical protein PoB_000920300 [Plakobranchus ocellatus]|uniref:Uncharacterized protein n=1 Tax=Plakobranchus ocellatus TaxID=259542 RepID=A0AAV3YJK8_9GAST|nr:hypothetical protein PoB_000920300 [Plakobranchus ocellatus]